MQRVTITNSNPKSEPGSIVVTQTTGIGKADKPTSSIAATLIPGQSVQLSVWEGSRLSFSERADNTQPARVDTGLPLPETGTPLQPVMSRAKPNVPQAAVATNAAPMPMAVAPASEPATETEPQSTKSASTA